MILMGDIFNKKFLYVIGDANAEALTGKMVIASDNLPYLNRFNFWR